jgi:hypothetical protein
MLTLAVRAVIGLTAVYVVALALIYVFQGRFIYPAPQEVDAPAPGFEAVTLRTSDGLALNAHWQPPEAEQPSVVYFHGNGGTLRGATDATQLLWTQGYGVLLVNYRGYGGNPGEPSEVGFYKDGRAAMGFLKAQGIAAARSIVIGNSIGSGTATQMGQEFGPAALILVAPLDSLPDVAANALPIVPVRSLLRDRFANIEKLPDLEMPVLIQHGTADTVVPIEHGQRLARAARKATFLTYDGIGHDLVFRTESKIARAEWLDRLGL